jgi:hypothetical protein
VLLVTTIADYLHGVFRIQDAMWSLNITLKKYSKSSPEGARSVTFSSSALISSFKNFSELTYGGLSDVAKETYDHD